jgi:hypothetical protein
MLETGVRQPTVTAIIAFEQTLGSEAGELVKRTVAAMRGKRIASHMPQARHQRRM